jgi:hypothetical protein
MPAVQICQREMRDSVVFLSHNDGVSPRRIDHFVCYELLEMRMVGLGLGFNLLISRSRAGR